MVQTSSRCAGRRPSGADPFAAEAPATAELEAAIEGSAEAATNEATEPAPSNLPEPLLEGGAPAADAELPPLTRRPASVDRPPTDGLFSGGQHNGVGERTAQNGSAASSAPRLFGASERPPLPMPGGAHVRERRDDLRECSDPPRSSARLLVSPDARREPAASRPGHGRVVRVEPAGVTTTGRSPDEVRAMLSRFRSGQRQAADDRDRPSDVDLDTAHTDEDL